MGWGGVWEVGWCWEVVVAGGECGGGGGVVVVGGNGWVGGWGAVGKGGGGQAHLGMFPPPRVAAVTPLRRAHIDTEGFEP